MNKTLHIGKPWVEQYGDAARLLAHITTENAEIDLYFECDKEYEAYLTPERCDPFVLLLLTYALSESLDIVCDVPMTERLHYQLRTCLLPVMYKNIDEYHPIEIRCEISEEVQPVKFGVATGFSAGVDSWDTVLEHLSIEEPHFKLNYLVLNNVGAFTAKNEKAQILFKDKKNWFASVAKQMDLPLVAINTNMLELFEGYEYYVTAPDVLKNAACIYALKRLFCKFYISSTCALDRFHIDIELPGYYDVFTTPELSTDYLMFHCTSTPFTRIEKVARIANNPLVQQNLSVCFGRNCSRCAKCTRTLFELYVLNKIDQFNNVFDVKYFKENLADRIAFSLADPHEIGQGFSSESLRAAKENNIKIPFKAYLLLLFKYKPIFFLKRVLKNNKLIRMFYEKHNIRKKLNFE